MPKPTAKDATSDAEPTPESVLLILRKRLANEERPAGTPSAIVAQSRSAPNHNFAAIHGNKIKWR